MRFKAALFVIALTLIASPAAASSFPTVISLPNGFRPEGIAIAGNSFYTGSLGNTGIYRGDIRTGEGAILPGTDGRPYTGMKVDDFGRLWASGAGTGAAYVFNATTGALITSFQFASAPTFINDVVVTDTAAYFTDSMKPVLYRVAISPTGAIGPGFTTIDLTGKFDFGAGFNLNGIDATPDGSTLIVVSSRTGKLYTIDTATQDMDQIDLGGATVTNGDGILLQGRTLYVVRNQNNEIVVIRLSPDFTSGTIVDRITSPNFDVPTTIARHGNALYAVNARFTTPPTPTTTYTVVRVER